MIPNRLASKICFAITILAHCSPTTIKAQGPTFVTTFNHGSKLAALVAIPTSDVFISVGDDGIIRFWQSSATKPSPEPIVTNAKSIRHVAVHAERQLLALIDGENAIQVWDLASRKRLTMTSLHRNNYTSICFTSRAPQLLAGDSKGNVSIYDCANDRFVLSKKVHALGVMFIATSSTSSKVLTIGRELLMCLSDSTLSGSAFFKPDPIYVTSGGFFDSDRKVITNGYEPYVRIWDTRKLETDVKYMATPTMVRSMVVNLTSEYAGYVSGEAAVNIMRLSDRTVTMTIVNQRPVHAIAFIGNGNEIVIGQADGTIAVWKVSK